MHRLLSKEEGFLFASRMLREVTDGVRAALEREVNTLEPNRLLNTAPADLATYLVEKYRIDPLVLRRDAWSVDEAECQIDVSRIRQRSFSDEYRGPFYMPGQRIRVVIPFEGDGELFYCRPDTFTSSFPRGVVESQSLVLSWEMSHDARGDLRPEIERAVRAIEQHLTRMRVDIDACNGSLPHAAASAIDSRRNRLLANQGRLASLGIPVRLRSGAPTTYAVPDVRKKLTPVLPPASSGAYTPEPVLADELYEDALRIVQNMSLVMERSPSAFAQMDEEALRQHFLVQLNGQFEGNATGETFNAAGKTDILLRYFDRNVFIAECKFWRGPKEFSEAIDQLLSYTSWRDTKTAILVFNRGTATTMVLEGVRSISKAHQNFKRTLPWSHDSGSRFVYHHPGDTNRELILTVLVFDVPRVST